MTDRPGTCHLVGCPGKGTVDEHRRPKPIGAPDDFTAYRRGTCLGFPRTLGLPRDGLIQTVCSLGGPWASPAVEVLSSRDLAELVDKHKANCLGPIEAAS